jgi:hypothetical protein
MAGQNMGWAFGSLVGCGITYQATLTQTIATSQSPGR